MKVKRFQKCSLAMGAAALVALSTVGTPGAQAKVIAQSASATALMADTALTSPIQSTTVTATGTSGPNTATDASISVGSIVEVNALNVSAQTKDAKLPNCQGPVECKGAFAHATAEVANASIGLPLTANVDLPILDDLDLDALVSLMASAIETECRLDAHNLLARTTILDAEVGVGLVNALLGGSVDADALVELPPNTTIDVLDGLLRIVINEQIIDWDPSDMRDGMPTDDHAAVTVNGVHVTSDLLDIDVILAQSNCEITGGSTKAIDLGNSWNTGGSTIEVNGVVDAGLNLPVLPLPELIDLLDTLVPLPVQDLVDIVETVLPLPLNTLSNNGDPLLELGGMLNLDLSGLGGVSSSLLGRL